MTFYKFSLVLALAASSLRSEAALVPMTDPHLQIVGRIDRSDPKVVPLHWSGSLVRANFNGTSLALRLSATPNLSGKPDPNWAQYLWVIVDGQDDKAVQIKVEEAEKDYPVMAGLKDGEHSLLIVKKTEAFSGDTLLSQIILDRGKGLSEPPQARRRRIQFIGDSLTCAYGVDCEGRPCEKDSANENAYHSWARVLADRFNADHHIIAQTGIGLRLGYTDRLLGEVIDGLRLSDFGATWDASRWQPDLVILCFFGNDADFGPNAANTVSQYKQSYVELIQQVRKSNPQAVILCTMGSWATDPKLPWVGIYNDAVREMNTAFKDSRVFAMPKGIKYTGIKTHPKIKDQIAIAGEVGDFVHAKLPLGW